MQSMILLLSLLTFCHFNYGGHYLVKTKGEKLKHYGPKKYPVGEKEDNKLTNVSDDELVETANCLFNGIMTEKDFKRYEEEPRTKKIKIATELLRTIEESKKAASNATKSNKKSSANRKLKDTIKKAERLEDSRPRKYQEAQTKGECLLPKMIGDEALEDLSEKEKDALAVDLVSKVEKGAKEGKSTDGSDYQNCCYYDSFYGRWRCSCSHPNYCSPGYYYQYCYYWSYGTYTWCYYYHYNYCG